MAVHGLVVDQLPRANRIGLIEKGSLFAGLPFVRGPDARTPGVIDDHTFRDQQAAPLDF